MRLTKRSVVTLAFSCWALVTGALLYYSSDTRLIVFDTEGTLASRSASLTYDQQLVTWLSQQGLTTRNTVIHITDPACPCYSISQPHRDSVVALAEKHGYQNQYLNWTPMAKNNIPASPAVVVISADNQLIYVGPYSSGAFCTADNGLVEPFIKGSSKPLPGAVVVTDAIGCYCNNATGN